jgi:hypothetical protein
MVRRIALACVLLLAACDNEKVTKPPTLFDRTVTTAEDTPVVVEVSLTAEDAGAVALSVITPPAHGAITGDGPTWRYAPAADFTGSDNFVVRGEDRFGSTTATVTMNVTPVNDAPIANPDSFADEFNVVLKVPRMAVLANDTDIDGQVLTVTEVAATTHGVPVLGDGDIVFTPETGFEGTATFEYMISDGTLSAHATVSVTIGVDQLPVAVDDVATTPEDTTLVISDATLLANDSDPDHQTIRISEVGNASHASVTHTGTQVTFVPDPDFHGAAGFDYTITDGFKTDVGSVAVTVSSVNDLPVAVSDSAVTDEDTTLTLTSATLVANDTDRDGDALTVSAVTPTANTHGSVTLAGAVVTYTPDANYNGSADFGYTISDGHGGTASATVSITVNAVNDAPVAVADELTTDEDTPLVIGGGLLTVNDTDVDGDALTVTAVATTATTHGSVSLTAGTIAYTPAASYNGGADFVYTVSDGHGGAATGSVAVIVVAVNDAPVVVTTAGTASYVENAAPVAVDPGITITDIDSASLVGATVQITTGCTSPEDVLALGSPALSSPSSGITVIGYVAATCTLTLAGTADLATYQAALRAVTYANTSEAPASSGRVVRFTVDDGQAVNQFGSADRDLGVTPVDDAPVAVNDSATVAEDSGATAISVLANDTDVDAGPRSISDVTQPLHGAVVITGGGTGLTYAPNANYCNRSVPSGLSIPQIAVDTFTYKLTPGVSTATVSMTVTCVDDPPVAVADAETVVEDSTGNVFGVLANDSDIDLGPRAVASVTQPTHGSAARGVSGLTVLYTPNPGYCNQAPNVPPDQFTYTLTPGTSSTTVSVTVLCACGKNKPTDFVVGSN